MRHNFLGNAHFLEDHCNITREGIEIIYIIIGKGIKNVKVVFVEIHFTLKANYQLASIFVRNFTSYTQVICILYTCIYY